MTIYFVLLCFIPVFSLFVRNKKVQSFVFSVGMFLILALRDKKVGIDLKNYLLIFKEIKNISFIDLFKVDMEIGYIFFNKLISMIFIDERIFIIIYSLILMVLIKKFIDKNSKVIWLSYFLFVSLAFYGSFFNIIRQAFAMVILLSSIESIKKRNLKNFLIYWIIAISFHYTAIFFIVIYFIYPIDIDLKYLCYLLCGIVINFLFLPKMISLLFYLIPKYQYRYGKELVIGEGKNLLLMMLVIFLLEFFIKKGKILNKTDKIFFHMMGLAVYLQSLSLGFSLFTRVTEYFFVSSIIIIPNLIINQRNKYVRILGIGSVIFFTTLYYKMVLEINLSQVVPYNFFWQV